MGCDNKFSKEFIKKLCLQDCTGKPIGTAELMDREKDYAKMEAFEQAQICRDEIKRRDE
tara:strand:- start:219 stop:395 length:177 start_codon:yes stop_codon:yes gene_type:complete